MPFEEETLSKGRVTKATLNNIEISRSAWLMLQDWIETLPRPWRIFQPLGFLAFGYAIQKGLDWYDAVQGHAETRGSDIAYSKLFTLGLLCIGVLSLVADFALRRQESRPIGSILDLCDHINESVGIDRERRRRSLWERIREKFWRIALTQQAQPSSPAQGPDSGEPRS